MTPKNSQLSEVKHLSFTCFPSLYIDKIILRFPGDIFSKDALSSYTETMENH